MRNENVYSVYDSKAKAWILPFFSDNDETAYRSFRTAALAEEHQFNVHADDYTLFWIGEWDETSGVIGGVAAKVSLGTALQAQEVDFRILGDQEDPTPVAIPDDVKSQAEYLEWLKVQNGEPATVQDIAEMKGDFSRTESVIPIQGGE